MEKVRQEKARKVIVNSGTFVGTTYSQLVGVSVTQSDITLEFVYVNPRDNSKGQVVSRVTLPIDVGINLARTILETTELHKNRIKGVQNG